MRELAIRVESLGKRYRIDQRREGTLREVIQSRLESVTKRRVRRPTDGGWFWALRDVSFQVEPGQVLGIMGRNGSGKSTLLRILSDITEPTEGYAEIHGRVSSLLEVGAGFQGELTGRENVYLNGAILGMKKSEIDRKFDEIVAFAEVERFIDTPVKHYSSGMHTRLAFAVAAHLDPEVLLVDEVLAVGDIAFQKKSMGKMESVSKQGRTVLFVSHNANAIEQLCSAGLILDQGRIQYFDEDIGAVVKRYLMDLSEEQTRTLWVNAGNEFCDARFTPRRVFVADASGELPPTPAHGDEPWLHIEGDIQRLDPAMMIGYSTYADDGSLLYTSFHTDGDPEGWPLIRPGRCRLRSKIPHEWLNEGSYRIVLQVRFHSGETLLPVGSFSPTIYLNVRHPSHPSPYWAQKRPGLLAPLIEWTA